MIPKLFRDGGYAVQKGDAMKSSESFDNIKFKGTFRIYQQRILDNAGKYLRDKKLNIVAAPGSGKTILGLEFICRLKAPCLILSPTTTIREQWGRRFEECFLPENENLNDYVSFNLNRPQLINSITYQALYSAINKIQINEEDETDCSDIDLFKVIKETGIKTICLDEAHHLQNEWQKSLEKFVSLLDKDIVIISLTATPPYDSSPAEWNRYINLCGEIDDEIFVPELVKEGTLCPHQDYVYFNYPTEEELKEIKQQREANKAAIYEILGLPFVANELVSRIEQIYKNNEEYFYKNYILFLRCLVFVSLTKKERALKVYKEITKQKKIPPFNLERCQAAVQFILESEEICNKDEKKAIRSILEKYSALERNKVCLNLNERLKKKIVSSAGKLNSISQIVKAEYSSLGSKLRMLILTDYIKKDAVKSIGSEKSINNISVVSIFNELLKQKDVKIGVVSGSLVILPLKAAEIFDEKKIKYSPEKINGIDYAIYTFSFGNKNKVNVVSELFENGNINVLIGTQSLLGEGWDAPCINSLILASFVGSFMLSNQMRGRAIRAYKKDPDKTANIWHLVTLEPETVSEKISSALDLNHKDYISSFDYETLIRRFECFVGPDYFDDKIQNGIERLSIIKPPYNKENVQSINQAMLELASKRSELTDAWKKAVEESSQVYITDEIPRFFKVPAFTFVNLFPVLLFTFCEQMFLPYIKSLLQKDAISNIQGVILLAASVVVYLLLVYKGIFFIARHISPQKSIHSMAKAVLNTLIKMGIISENVKLKIISDRNNIYIMPKLSNATIHEQNVFNTAMQELLSPIDNPKYVIVKRSLWRFIQKYDYSVSFACPSVIYKTKDSKKILEEEVKKHIGDMDVVYCYNEKGRKIMNKSRQFSFISRFDSTIRKRQKV